MSTRERILGIVTLSMVMVALLWLILQKALFGPAAETNRKADELALKVSSLEAKVAMDKTYRETLNNLMQRSFGLDESVAGSSLRAHLITVLQKAGIDSRAVALTPFTGKRVGEATEVGWLISTRGSLKNVADLLYLLQSDPHLHRTDQVTWSPVADSTDVDFKARVSTLVLDPVPGSKPAEIDAGQLAMEVDLKGDARQAYDLVVSRDVFRPYIKRPPPPPPPPVAKNTPTRRSDPPPAQPPADPPVKVVGLPTFAGKSHAVLQDTRSGQTQTLNVGDDLVGGQIVMIDYRAMPHPADPLILSYSRVIVQIDASFWAIEVGQVLTDKRQLPDSALPTALRQTLEPPPTTPVSTPPEPDTPVESPDENNPTPTGDNAAETGADAVEFSENDASPKESRDVP